MFWSHRMFASNELLRKKTPLNGIGRKEFIEHLVEEFHTTTNVEAQEQVTANLANFAYDPINFQHLRDAAALDLFLQLLTLPNERLVLHGIAGICNICVDFSAKIEITKSENIKTVFEVFQSTKNTEITINLLTLFYFLLSEDESLIPVICTPENLQKVRCLKNSCEERVKTLATILLEDYAVRNLEVQTNV